MTTLTSAPLINACDCHTHVFGSAQAYLYAADRQYTPDVATVAQLLQLQDQLGLQRVVIVQPSPYGSDNRCTVDGLRQINALNDRARGVAVIDTRTSDTKLHELHSAGVRGIRLNLATGGVSDPRIAQTALQWAAQRVAPWGWHVQMYTSLAVLAPLADVIATLPVAVVVDHFAGAKAALGTAQPGFEVLLGLVQSGKVWVKLSAAQRISDLPDCADVAPIAMALIAANPARMLWGSDWPHPGAAPGQVRCVDQIERFNCVDDDRALARLKTWAHAAGPTVAQQILVDNPAALYAF